MKKRFTITHLLIVIFVGALILLFLEFSVKFAVKKVNRRIGLNMCQANLRIIGISLQKYAADNNGMYPTHSEWCDLLVEKTGIDKDKFWCRSVSYNISDTPMEEMNNPIKVSFVEEFNDEEGQKKYVYNIVGSNYGLNPIAEPNSAPDIVLLFETEPGWNQFGGPESVSVKNHLEIYGKEGCNVLFNDGTVKFIKPKDIDKLNWSKSN